MNKIIALSLLAAGVILLVYGVNASHSIASGVSKAVTGEPTDRALVLMIVGGVLSACGVGGLMWGNRS